MGLEGRLRELEFSKTQILNHPDKYPPYKSLFTPYGWVTVKELVVKLDADICSIKTFLVKNE